MDENRKHELILWLIKHFVFIAVFSILSCFGGTQDLIASDLSDAPLKIVHTPKIVHVEWNAETSIKEWAAFYKVSATQMRETIKCESQFNPKANNTSDPQGGAHGIAQFLAPTFARMSHEAGLTLNVWNADDSIRLMAYGFSRGYAHEWTCWRNLYGSI